MCACVLSRFSHVRLFAALWTIAQQAPLSMGFSRQEHWSGLLCPPPGDLPSPGLVHHSPDHIIIFLTLYLSFHILLWFSLRIPAGRSGWLRWGLSGKKGRERKKKTSKSQVIGYLM